MLQRPIPEYSSTIVNVNTTLLKIQLIIRRGAFDLEVLNTGSDLLHEYDGINANRVHASNWLFTMFTLHTLILPSIECEDAHAFC